MTSARRAVLSSSLALLAACHPQRGSSAASPGYGVVGCYVGRGVMPEIPERSETLIRPNAADYPRGPWLVIDTVRGLAKAPAWSGVVVFRQDSTWARMGMNYVRVSRDSVFLVSGFMAPVNAHLMRRSGDLRGSAEMYHDFCMQRPDGTLECPISHWSVWLVPVACAEVPQIPERGMPQPRGAEW